MDALDHDRLFVPLQGMGHRLGPDDDHDDDDQSSDPIYQPMLASEASQHHDHATDLASDPIDIDNDDDHDDADDVVERRWLENALIETRLHDLTDQLQKIIDDLNEVTRPEVYQKAEWVMWRAIELKNMVAGSRFQFTIAESRATNELEAALKEIDKEFGELLAHVHDGGDVVYVQAVKRRRISGKTAMRQPNA